MSTKTTFKRIALVAVAALGLGVFTSVAPASAALSDVSAISAGTSAPARTGVSSGATTITLTTTAANAATLSASAQITSAPAGSTKAALAISAGSAATAAVSGTYSDTATVTGSSMATLDTTGVAYATFTGSASATTTTFVVSLNADVAGSYQVLVTLGGSASAGYSAGLKATSYTLTTSGVPTTITAASYAGTVTTSGGLGQLMSLSLKDAAGAATVLGLNESIDITADTAAVTFKNGLTTAGSSITYFDSASANVAGKYFYRVVNTGTAIAADGTTVVTFAGNGLLSPTLTTNTSVTLKKAVLATGTITVTCTTTKNCTGSGGAAWSSGDFYTTGAQSLKWVVSNDSTAAAVVMATEVSDAAGFVYNSTATKALNATATTSVSTTAPAVTSTGLNPTVTLLKTALNAPNSDLVATVRYAVPAAKTIAISGSSSVLSATAGSTTWNVLVSDQYGVGIAYSPVTVTVAGRNTVAQTSIGVTDASGYISYKLTDAGTTGTKDTVTFGGAGTTIAGTVTYGTVTVAKASFTGGGTSKGVAPTTVTVNPLQAGDTPEASAVPASVVLTDAAGNLLAGVPVTWTVSGTTAAIDSTMVTTYSDAAGTASSSVYAWVAGTYTVTATAGGITGTGSYTFANSRPADARVISGSADGGILTAKVVDRFGNPVSGVLVYASRVSGSGYFGSGVTKISSSTGVAGTAEFIVNGTADIKLSTLSYDAAAGTNPADQTCALAGNLTCALGATAAVAFTATTDGTATVAAANVGSSIAAAGVNAVTVVVNNNAAADSSQAAADAAAEATDAANAATDAANAAAEAADAATAAAQDAADAVAALSTQVSEMVNALKKQITALTNLVIKIQKKVKA
jgi:hypothetical protein